MRPLKLPPLADREPTPTPDADMLAVDIPWIAKRTPVSVRHLRRLDSSRDIPGRFVAGRRVLFQADVIRRWIAAGMPDRQTFELLAKRSK